MKNLLLIISIVGLLAACKSSPEQNLDARKDLLPMDTTKLYNSSVLTDIGTVIDEGDKVERKVKQTRKAAPKKKSVVSDVVTAPKEETKAPVIEETKTPEVVTTTQSASGTSTSTAENTGAGTTTGTETAKPVEKKKGWSDAAKGATIGAVGGAIAGAVINGKNRGVGAVIGGVVGAAGGYILGRKKDKQTGRADMTLDK